MICVLRRYQGHEEARGTEKKLIRGRDPVRPFRCTEGVSLIVSWKGVGAGVILLDLGYKKVLLAAAWSTEYRRPGSKQGDQQRVIAIIQTRDAFRPDGGDGVRQWSEIYLEDGLSRL